jgi:hypothetical protein
MSQPHTTLHGIPGLHYTRRSYRHNQLIEHDGQRYRVTLVRNDGDVHGDGCDAVEVFTQPEPESTRICQG